MTDMALVTGGARNIGAAIAKRLKADGFRIATLDMIEPEHDLSDVHLEIDLAEAEATAAAVAELIRRERVTRLVNNAGIVRPASLEETLATDLDDVLAVNLKAAVVTTQAALPAMRAAGSGRIVNIASRVALGKELRTAYAASKAGLIGLTKSWALELARDGITVNAVGPGPIRTSLFDEANPPDSARTRRIVDGVPVGRMGTPEDVAEAVGFFCGERTGFITGQVLYVCGGMTVGAAS